MAKSKRKLIWRILDGLLIVILLFFITLIGYNVIMKATHKNYVPNFFGIQFYTVVSDSMEPVIPVGSLVTAKQVKDYSTVKKGDILVFRGYNEALGGSIVVTHYLYDILEEDGRTRYITCSASQMATGESDGYAVYNEDILGVYVSHTPVLGTILLTLSSNDAIAVYIILLFSLIVCIIGRKIYNKLTAEKRN